MALFTATCLFGLERLLGEQIDELGGVRVQTIDGRVTFKAPLEHTARYNINLRYAQRLYINLGSFPAPTFNDLFEGVRALPLEDYIGKYDAFPVKGHSIHSALTSIPDCQKIVKKAAVERLKSKYGISYFEETGIKYQLEFFILKDTATLMIDTSGQPLHKRGYRTEANDAPLRETLAAAMVKLAHTRPDVLFWDPFCGSGTIPIEAALLMTNTPPGLNRSFAAEQFPFIQSSVWDDARDEGIAGIIEDCEFEAYASDIDAECVKLTQRNISRAGVGKYVKCFQKNALDIETFGRRGTVVCNPPYGERMMTKPQVEKLYSDMGKAFSNLGSWQIYVISSCDDFERLFHRRADKVRKLYNGMIRCNYYQFFKRKDNSRL